MARKPYANPVPMTMPEEYRVPSVAELENRGLWYTAQKVRNGEEVYPYEYMEAEEHASAHYRGKHPTMQAVPPIRSSSGTNSVASMMSEGCPPNTGRRYKEV